MIERTADFGFKHVGFVRGAPESFFGAYNCSSMDNERIREICLSLPYAAETLNWGHHLVYWVGDREIGGKMFAMTDVDGTGLGVLWFHCGAERFYELLETEGIYAAPHLARAHWVAVERWDTLRPRQVEDELRQAHQLIYEKLPKRTKTCWPCRRRKGLKSSGTKEDVAAASQRPERR